MKSAVVCMLFEYSSIKLPTDCRRLNFLLYFILKYRICFASGFSYIKTVCGDLIVIAVCGFYVKYVQDLRTHTHSPYYCARKALTQSCVAI